MPQPLTVAAAQPRCVDLDVAANAALHAEAVLTAQAPLVVFPELSLTGYDLAAPAVAVDDPRLAPLVDACRTTGAMALAGAPVRGEDGREYIATLAVTGEGAAPAYAKMHLHGDERIRFTPGAESAVLEIGGWRLGLAVCRDAAVPQHAAEAAALGIDAYVASTLYGAGPEQSACRDGHMQERATVHGVWVVLSTVAGPSGEYRETSGGSGVWAPDGSRVAQAGPEPGAVVTATLN
ncbi:hydrolase [Streptomyces filipinensis]|uniref:Hydrolase n=1 Tax=Streptomyces filipinensis TaxID=66887 RepID=A0A918IIA3_9ACTN|nr:carbon-nitrogen hydrolase family protein [Streptomyces filipinensis]GGV13154.1 hydrolase [Streptomyces filipinensis]